MTTYAHPADARAEEARDLALDADDLGAFDVASFTDYLFADCDGCSPIAYRAQIRDVTPADFDGEPASDVLAIACDPGQPHATRIAALDALIAANDAYRAQQRAVMEARAQAREMVRQWTRRAAA